MRQLWSERSFVEREFAEGVNDLDWGNSFGCTYSNEFGDRFLTPSPRKSTVRAIGEVNRPK